MPADAAPKAAIFGCAGQQLTDEERRFFADAQPLGFILFGRNCDTPDQIARLVADLRLSVGRQDAPVLIDQEGGRVARLRPPHWPEYPAGSAYGAIYARDREAGLEAARLGARLIAAELHRLGIDVDCLPVLDVPSPDAHDVIGDRAYGDDPAVVADIGRAAADGLLAGGVLPVIKHIPGHGRARADTHHELPVVETVCADLARTDFAPFRALSDLPIGMTAHVVFSDIDPDHPATTSKTVIADIVRGEIGFDGLLLTDDLNMQALTGSLGDRAAASLAAGCDIALHCSGEMAEMREVAAAVGAMTDPAVRRFDRCRGQIAAPEALDIDSSRRRLQDLLC